MRSYTSLHDAFKLTSTAAYRDTVSRTITYNGAGQLWRQLQEGQDVGHLYGFDALGRLVADTLAYAVSPPECNGEDEASGGQCPYPFWSRRPSSTRRGCASCSAQVWNGLVLGWTQSTNASSAADTVASKSA